MIDGVLEELDAALDQDGVYGVARRRVLIETRDHLVEASAEIGEAEAVRAFGSPRELAGLVAAELATTATRTAALATFAVLGVAGLVYAALFLTLPLAGAPDVFGGKVPGLGVFAFIGIVFAPQIAFVSGCLALIRVVRVRGRGALGADELRVQRWRAAVALGAGIVTFAGLVVAAVDFRHDLAGWWVGATLAAGAVLMPTLAATARTIARSARPRALVAASTDDVFDDLAPVFAFPALKRLELPSHPWRFAALVAAVAAAPVALGGVVDGDPFDGLVRAATEVAALLGCYATLCRPLGLIRRGA